MPVENVVHVVWKGSFYEFMRAVERLTALCGIYNRKPDAETKIHTGLDVREEIVNSSCRSVFRDVDAYRAMIQGMLQDADDQFLVHPLASRAVDSCGVFHFDSKMTVVCYPGNILRFFRQDPRPQVLKEWSFS